MKSFFAMFIVTETWLLKLLMIDSYAISFSSETPFLENTLYELWYHTRYFCSN